MALAYPLPAAPSFPPRLRVVAPGEERFRTEVECDTGRVVPLGTCRCWSALPRERATRLQADLVAWAEAVAVEHPELRLS